MHVRKSLEYALVIGVWTTFVFVIVSPLVSEHYTEHHHLRAICAIGDLLGFARKAVDLGSR